MKRMVSIQSKDTASLPSFVANTDVGRLHEILEKLWWRMRELVFEEKPAAKRRRRSQKQTVTSAAPQQGEEPDVVSSAACLASV